MIRFVLFLLPYLLFSQGVIPKQLAFDAETTRFTKDGKVQIFEGDVVAVGSGMMLTADHIFIDRKKKEMVAKGHVILLTQSQVYLGDSLNYYMKSGDFLLVNSMLIVSDEERAKKIADKVLGISLLEMKFQEQKNLQITDIEKRKESLREKFVDSGSIEPNPVTIDKYKLLLEQETLIKSQENPYLARLTPKKRERYVKRRQQWDLGKKKKIAKTAFFRINGEKIERVDSNNYSVEGAFWTPCKCDDDEIPAWGVRSDKLKGQMGGYIDFYHPILEVKGIPILYLPYLKIPVKDERQSGFLMPSFSYRNVSGNIFSQPVYFALAENYDATLTSEIYEKRGTKLGVEFRYQQKQYSGWTLNIESIRDRQWTEALGRRQVARDNYLSESEKGLERFCLVDKNINSITDPDSFDACMIQNRNRLKSPSNTWRGAKQWKGLSILAPRVSFVSHGDLYSDHRYVEDLTLYEDFQSALEGNTRANYFSTSKYQTYYDGEDLYLGAGGRFADRVRAHSQFQGQQIPIHLAAQSRMVNIGWHSFPIYTQLHYKHYTIADFKGDDPTSIRDSGLNRSLGHGYWQRYLFSQVSPIISSGIFKLDQFFDYEIRRIAHSKLESTESSIRSYRAGFTLNLPLDGDIQFGATDSGDPKFLRHYMNWAITFSVRPSVERSGPYGNYRNLSQITGEEEGGYLVYQAGDRKEYYNSHNNTPLTDSMLTHRNVAFSTTHTWDLFDKGWKKIPAKDKKIEKEISLKERARKELLYSSSQPVSDIENIFDGKKWSIDRYQLIEKNRLRFMTFSAGTSYDFIQAERREEKKRLSAEGEIAPIDERLLPKAWSDVVTKTAVKLYSFSISNETTYDIYIKKATEQDFRIGFPKFYKSSLSLGFSIKDDPTHGERSSIITKRREETYLGLSTALIPNFAISTWLGRRTSRNLDDKSDPVVSDYQTVSGFEYISPTDCWKASFRRQKKYGVHEKNSEYLIQLSILFLGNERNRDLSPSLIRYLPGRS